jgi:(1->4)-alpha-D-glucan 1-alpha-D-glucosylmutase
MTEPRATYRLQLTGEFGFARARELVPYLKDLGISETSETLGGQSRNV